MVIWKKVHNQHPFGILEVGRVGLFEFDHSPSLPDYLRNTLLGGEAIFYIDRDYFGQVNKNTLAMKGFLKTERKKYGSQI